MKSFVQEYFLPSLQNDIIKKGGDESKILTLVNECFDDHKKVFDKVSSEKDCLKYIQSRGFIQQDKFEIRRTFEEHIYGNSTWFIENSVHGVSIKLRHMLKLFLEVPNMFNKIIKYINSLNSEKKIISNILQGKFWLDNFKVNVNDNTYLFPLFLYYDEIEVGNALVSHAGKNKFEVVYLTIACLPPKFASRLSSIFFSTIIRASDLKKKH